MLQIIVGRKEPASPAIVWRNPNRLRSHRRRHSFEPMGERALYIMQEFVEDGQNGYWAAICGLEVVPGGRAA
jgi:hypothetical protein